MRGYESLAKSFLFQISLSSVSLIIMKEKLEAQIKDVLNTLGLPEVSFVVEHPADLSHGDYSTNVAMLAGKTQGVNPLELAEKIAGVLRQNQSDSLSQIIVAKPGFINFFLSNKFLVESIGGILKRGSKFGSNDSLAGQKTIVEYTDANPFKEMHIGHLMSNAIGESFSRIYKWNGAEVRNACYQGDKGIHVARAVAHKLKSGIEWRNAQDVAASYAEGSKSYETEEVFKAFVVEINKKIYDESDKEVNEAYMLGRKLTLEYFEAIYRKLDTKFDHYFFESTTGEFGKAIVHDNTPKIFEESEGAIVYHGEKRDPALHTRVFINKEGLPTYEAKELGLAKIKYDIYPYDISIVVTGNEINEYFRVLLRAMKEIFPELAEKTKHISHGMLRLPTGKMSSRTGDVITAEWLINEVKSKVMEKLQASERNIENKDELAEMVAVGAIKYSILKQTPGRDIIFDFDKSLSFEGDSGPYLQYSFARANSVLERAKDLEAKLSKAGDMEIGELHRMLYRFPEIVKRSLLEMSPNMIVTYLTEIASMFNKFYAENIILDEKNPELSSQRIALTSALARVLKNGMDILAIPSPLKM